MSWIRTGQKYSFKNIGLTVEIRDSYYVITDVTGAYWNFHTTTRRQWLDWLFLNDKQKLQPQLCLEDFAEIFKSIHIGKWAADNKEAVREAYFKPDSEGNNHD